MYRFRQFFGALAARIDDHDEQVLARLLTPPQLALFRRMARNDQRHSLDVCATLRQAGHEDPALLVAALLHDAGKALGRVWLWQRTLVVLLRRWSPGMLSWLERGDWRPPTTVRASWWRRGFVVNGLHPQVGARWAAEAGCSPTTVDLIRRHQEHLREVKTDQDRLLAALQWADGVN
ncbi:MAG: hypothetical protein PVF45_05315 [Anaerolineae bacterium]